MAEIKGKCVAVLPVQEGVSAKGTWKKRDFVIEYGEEYPKKAAFQLFGDKVEMSPREGDKLTVFYSIESKEHNGRWFTNLNCWKLEGFTGNLGQQASAPAATSGGTTTTEKGIVSNDDDGGLPF